LIAITLVGQLAVLFVPLDIYFSTSFFLAIVILGLLRMKQLFIFFRSITAVFQKLSLLTLLFMTVAWLMIVMINSGPIVMDDTDSYHLQMIKWIHEYGSVPGIANLHNRFGFNSSWFSSISLFIPFSDHRNFYTVLNGTVSVWLASFLIVQINSLNNFKKGQSFSFSDISALVLFLAILLCWPMLRGNSTNANYDFVTTSMILVLFLKTIMLRKETTEDVFISEWITWPIYLFTIRIINFPLLLLSLYGFYTLTRSKEWKKIVKSSAVSLLLLVPFIARNVILSGYPFYPSPFANIFDVDWKVDRGMINSLLEYIKYFNRVNTTYADISQTKQLGFPAWVISWFHYLFYYDKLVVIAGIFSYAASLLWIKRFLAINNKFTKVFVLAFILQLLSWFFVAPDPRFVYGELLCGSVLFISLLVGNRSYPAIIKPVYLFIVLFAGIFLYTFFKIGRDAQYRNFMLPSLIPQPPVKEVQVDQILLRIPEKILHNWNPRCYATELPCLYIVNPKLRARGKTVANGFRLEK